MIELPDDELDKLFRKSSEELDPTYEPDDWNDLRKRLDQQDGRTPAAWWRKWWPVGLLALLIPVGIWLYSVKGENGGRENVGREEGRREDGVREDGVREDGVREDGVREDGRRENVVREDGVREDLEKGRVLDAEAEGRSGTGGEVVVEGNPSGRDEAVEGTSRAGIEDAGAVGNAEIRSGEREAVASGTVKPGKERQIVRATPKSKLKAGGRNALVDRARKDIDIKQDIDNEQETSEKDAGKSSSLSGLNAASAKSSPLLPRSQSKAGGVFLGPSRSTVEGGDGAFSNTNIHSVEAANAAAAPAELERTSVTASELNGKALKWSLLTLPGISMPVYELPEPPAPPKQSSMSAEDQPLVAVRFGYSPDLSTVGLKDFSKPGTAVSLLAEYAVLPRLYVQSGVVWSRKVYYAPAEAYKLPKIPHTYPPEMSGIDGVCRVLEIPVSLRYDITSGQRSRWFGSAGLSSYHMNDEKYKYYFVNPNDPNAAKYPGWNGNTGWYWFSHASISAGYEYRISRKLSLLAEPSVRLPLKRVGFGNVNLITTGLWLSVRYTPVFK